jgi:hypothetical protein
MLLSLLRTALVTALTVSSVAPPLTAGRGSEVQLDSIAVVPAGAQRGTITGTAWRADDAPASHARLRLRNVGTGRVVLATQADAAGRYTFAAVPPGTYVVELVDDDERLLGVSQVFGLSPGETIATFIRLGTRVPWYSGFFTNAAAAAVATAASIGVTALGEGGQPASARR